MKLLPHWVLTDKFPAFFDSESKTAIEQTARVYGAMQELIKEYNAFVDSINKHITDFENAAKKDYEVFTTEIRQEFQDFIDVIELKIKSQDVIIEDAVNYMKSQLNSSIRELFEELRENGDLSAAVLNAFDDIIKSISKETIARKNADDEIKSLLSAETAARNEQIKKESQTRAEQISALNSRMDTFTSLEQSASVADAELQDIRTGFDGTVYESAGTSVREQTGNLANKINSFCYSEIDSELWEIGAIYSGSLIDATDRIRTKNYLSDDVFSVSGNNELLFSLYAYESGAYIGRWNGSNFLEEEGTIFFADTYYMTDFRKNYPAYQFKLSAKKIDDSEVSENDFSITIFYKNNFLPKDSIFSLMVNAEIMEKWDIARNVSAVLTADGTFFLLGSGSAPMYSADKLPPWCTVEYLSNIKRIIIQKDLDINSLTYYFYNSTNNAATVINERLDVPESVKYMVGTSFSGLELRHLNFAMNNPTIETLGCILTNNTNHCIYSIPSVVATDTVINQVVNCIKSRYSGRSYAVGLFITDSLLLRNAIYSALDEISEDYGSIYNIGVIYCSSLGSDGFPEYWTAYMKKSIKEIIPYVGRHFETLRINGSYQAVGITGLSNYDSIGIPSVYDVDANCRIRVYDSETGRTSLREVNMSSYFSGKPSTNALEQLTNGFSCSGFVAWFFWRYFNENFALGSVMHFFQNRSEYGNNKLPLTEISKEELKPFDIMVMYTAEYGHMGIFLGWDGEGRIRMLNSTGAAGLSFGIWDETQPEESYKYYRFTKKGISSGMLVFEE